MKNKFLKLALFCQRYGFLRGIKILAAVFLSKKNKLVKLKLPGIIHPVFLRSKSSDEFILQQIFIKEEYTFKVNKEPNIIIDAGANIGFAAVYFANKFPDAQIICLEPEPNNFEILQKNISQYPNITALKKGLWDKSAFLQVIDTGLDNWGFTVKECSKDYPEAIEATSLPDIMSTFSLPKLDMIKMDIEGSEKEILTAPDVQSWLSTCDTLIIELHDRMKEGTSKSLFSALNNYQYLLDLKGENLIFQLAEKK